ncbi:hypothetical protein BSF38_01965 [Paludisphaera borealis]|uniref:Uncharacterized protein n=1 Tax=Paludisphaera borealis TaxID=1387353 RepID=A0A1U7CNI0_9BACT|nr:hypothetical protein BSF38_01965 [Paludisphaera borealis]
MGRGRVELPTHGFSVRCEEASKVFPKKDLRLSQEAFAHHLPTDTRQSENDVDLAEIADAWPKLDESTRTSILKLVHDNLGARKKPPTP